MHSYSSAQTRRLVYQHMWSTTLNRNLPLDPIQNTKNSATCVCARTRHPYTHKKTGKHTSTGLNAVVYSLVSPSSPSSSQNVYLPIESHLQLLELVLHTELGKHRGGCRGVGGVWFSQLSGSRMRPAIPFRGLCVHIGSTWHQHLSILHVWMVGVTVL